MRNELFDKREFWTGKQFRSYEDFSTVTKAAAVEKVTTAIASTANKDLGIMSATQAVSYSSGGLPNFLIQHFSKVLIRFG